MEILKGVYVGFSIYILIISHNAFLALKTLIIPINSLIYILELGKSTLRPVEVLSKFFFQKNRIYSKICGDKKTVFVIFWLNVMIIWEFITCFFRALKTSIIDFFLKKCFSRPLQLGSMYSSLTSGGGPLPGPSGVRMGWGPLPGP